MPPGKNLGPRDPRESVDPPPGRQERKRRSGSRLLLAVALAGGVVAALFAGAGISDFLCDFLGVTSTAVRLAVKVAGITLALPAGFYLVERFFLRRAKAGDSSGETPPRRRHR